MSDSTPPFVFGTFQLGPSIGEGDMGTVYKAQNTQTQETVALKILDKVDTSREGMRGAAVELIEFAASLTHTHLHPISQVLESPDGLTGIVMPMAAARSVNRYLVEGKTIPRGAATKVITQIASVLHFLHEQEVAHGSIKPTNVLLDAQGNATLSDLPMTHLRELGLIPKEPSLMQRYYMAPEVVYHASPEPSHDVFSLGVLAYHLLTGRIPFDDPEPLARKKVSREGLPPILIPVLLRAMTSRIRLRYQTVAAFMQDFQGAANGKIDPETERLFSLADEPSEHDEP
ncbi:MAG: serine/threonine protein kinase [Chloroflexi bacterium]|nr:serine/threonine protein kinase [Chloroflexota bacterium]